MKSINKLIRLIFVVLLLVLIGLSNVGFVPKVMPFQDITHNSKVFGKEKTYRLYLPDNYHQSEKKYPVIYFFHGWGGRYFKDYSGKLEYEKLGELVNKYQFIMVMWDGNMEESEPRPYNIGNHSDIKYRILMKDYFPELVSSIDSTYRTYPDRNHRGIIGFSMGGFMSYYIAGKYPHMVSAAVNLVGSPEFFIGLPDNHTLYQVRYTLENLRDVGLLFVNRTNCPMTGLNDEVNNSAVWHQLDNYEYHKLEGDHKIDEPSETKVFGSAVSFIINQFDRPAPLRKNWSHYDLCQEFSVWDYSVKSNNNKPGFLFLRNVDANGFGFYVRKWLPEGPTMKDCKATVLTAPIYNPSEVYEISIYNMSENKLSKREMPADKDGRLHFELTGEGSEIGIAKKEQQADLVVLGYQLSQNRKFLRINNHDEISINIFNRGGSIKTKSNLKVILSCADSSVSISEPAQILRLQKDQQIFKTKPFKILSNKIPPSNGSPEWYRMKVEMDYDTLHFQDNFLLPVFYDVPYFTNIRIDDGRIIRTIKEQGDNGNPMVDSIYGTGNGDGIVTPGEQIMLYENGHRLKLFTDDPYVLANDEKQIDEVLPAIWPDGFTLSSVVKIADNCPLGHEIEFLTHYETKTHMPIHRQVKWGKVKIKVE